MATLECVLELPDVRKERPTTQTVQLEARADPSRKLVLTVTDRNAGRR